jgi:acetyl-CoA carboxylase carboxyltransferase component
VAAGANDPRVPVTESAQIVSAVPERGYALPPAHLAGAFDIDSSDKIARHVWICDAFDVRVVTFVDTSRRRLLVPTARPGR